jgi:multiple sugar transport system permease protein
MNKEAIAKEKKAGYWERNRLSHGYLFRKSIKHYLYILVRMLMLFGMCFLILQPILNKISVSFMEERDLYNSMIISVPEHVTFDNYKLSATFLKYSVSLPSTFMISLVVAFLQIFVCTMVGYGFARFKFPLKKFWFACVMLTVMIPPQSISTSLHLQFRYFDIFGLYELITGSPYNMLTSPAPYLLLSLGCAGLKNGLYIYMIRQFFRNVPPELEEAAYVDGCGTFRTFIRIMLPQSVPILTSCFLFAFVWQWTDGFYSKMFLGKVKLLSIQLNGIADTFDAYIARELGNPAGATVGYAQCIVATGTLMVIVPLLILYLFAQKGFVESLSSTGIKM